MKIGMVVNNLEVSGGYQKLVIRLAQSLNKFGHEVKVYSPDINKKDCYPQDIKSIDIVTIPSKLKAELDLKAKMVRLSKLIDNDTEIIIIHDLESLHAINALQNNHKPKVIWMLNNQLPEMFIPYHAAVRKSLIKTRKLNIYARFKIALDDMLELKSIRHTTDCVDVFATYDEINKNLVRKGLGRNAKIVYAGADLKQFEALVAKRNLIPHSSEIKLLSVGVLFPHRRYEDIIESIPLIKKKGFDVKLTVVGRHDLHKEYADFLKSKIRTMGLQNNVNLIEYATPNKLMKLYEACEMFIFVNDGFTWGISVFEAVAAEIPVVITNNIGAHDLIKDDKNGWVVEPKNPKEIASKIIEIKRDPKLARQKAQTGHNLISKLLSWDDYSKRLLDTIR